ncbi:MAG: transposase, partial [Dehalococcoidia bacterium]|nr:transposase [Dehalococcoidia bacterium]
MTTRLWAPGDRSFDPAVATPIVRAAADKARANERTVRAAAVKKQTAAAERSRKKWTANREAARAALANEPELARAHEAELAAIEHRAAASRIHSSEKEALGTRCRKLRLFPSGEQATVLAVWLEAVRQAKNLVIEYINEKHEYGLQRLRRAAGLVRGDSYRRHLPRRLHGVPRDVIDQAVRDCRKDCKSRLAQLKAATAKRIWRKYFQATRKHGAAELTTRERADAGREISAEVRLTQRTWKFAFNRKRDLRETMLLSNRSLNQRTSEFAGLFGGPDTRETMRTGEDDDSGPHRISALPSRFTGDSRLVHERATGEYYLCIPVYRPTRTVERTGPTIVSIDPGVRTFATCYNPAAGEITEHGKSGPGQAYGLETRTTEKRNKKNRRRWGVGAAITFLNRKAGRIERRADADRKCAEVARRAAVKLWREACERLTAVRERRKAVQKARRKRRAAARVRKRSRDLVAAMHWRIADELCRTADVILLPDFRPSRKVPRVDPTGKLRRLGKATVARMLGQAHATFRDRLLSKAEEFGVRVEIVREDFTSITCGSCGAVNRKLGSAHVFDCPRCGWRIGRDENGARNVFLRYIADNGLCAARYNRGEGTNQAPPCPNCWEKIDS